MALKDWLRNVLPIFGTMELEKISDDRLSSYHTVSLRSHTGRHYFLTLASVQDGGYQAKIRLSGDRVAASPEEAISQLQEIARDFAIARVDRVNTVGQAGAVEVEL